MTRDGYNAYAQSGTAVNRRHSRTWPLLPVTDLYPSSLLGKSSTARRRALLFFSYGQFHLFGSILVDPVLERPERRHRNSPRLRTEKGLDSRTTAIL
jgi:hypothetical protein